MHDEIDGRNVPRSWDQRNAVSFSANYRLGERWNFNLAGVWHSGWPTTPLVARVVDNRFVSRLGQRNSERFDDCRRLDVRVSRALPTRRGTFLVKVSTRSTPATRPPSKPSISIHAPTAR